MSMAVLVPLWAQVDADSDRRCSFTQAFRGTGWEIPGRKNPQLGRRMILMIDGRRTDMWVTRIEPPKQPVTLLLPLCSRRGGGLLELPMQPVRIQDIWRFDVNEHVFAFGVRAGWVAPSESGPPIEIGTASEILYLDDKGDGVFRIMKYSPYPFQPSRPDWLSSVH
jgi:hypothetical protein